MKFISSKTVWWTFFLFCIVLTAAGTTATAQETEGDTDYYLVDGKKIILTPSQNYNALKLKPDAGLQEITVFKTDIHAAGFGEVQESPILERYGIVLVRIKKGISPSSFRGDTDRLGKQEKVEAEIPVYKAGNIDQVLVNEFNVQFKPDAAEEAILQSLKSKNANVVRKHKKIKNRYVVTFTGKGAREALALSNQYYSDPLVTFIEPNFVRIFPERPRMTEEGTKPAETAAVGTPSDPLFKHQWYLHNTGNPRGIADADIDAPEAWAVQRGSSSVIIAIIDEGVDTTHKDLKDKIVTPYDATDGDNNQEPRSGDAHGTACAGLAAAITDNAVGIAGIGWKVKIMPIRIAYSDASGRHWVTTDEIIEDGIRTAVDRGAHVLSNSWGGGSASNAINSAIDYAIAKKRVVVFAAGNHSGAVIYPANQSPDKVLIAVSATNEWDQFKTKTSFDKEEWWGSCFGPEVSVCAPGVHIFTTDISGGAGYSAGDYTTTFNGTSSATPLVAGTAALLLSKNPNWTPQQVRDRLQKTADDLGPKGFDSRFGHGRVSACKALGGKCNGGSNCASTGAAGFTANSTMGQGLVNIFLLFSTLLLFLFYVIARKARRRTV